jgi:hypothetical protein
VAVVPAPGVDDGEDVPLVELRTLVSADAATPVATVVVAVEPVQLIPA